jgi:hypothetical protein
MPLMERFGVATAEEVDIDTLADRLHDETVNRWRYRRSADDR